MGEPGHILEVDGDRAYPSLDSGNTVRTRLSNLSPPTTTTQSERGRKPSRPSGTASDPVSAIICASTQLGPNRAPTARSRKECASVDRNREALAVDQTTNASSWAIIRSMSSSSPEAVESAVIERSVSSVFTTNRIAVVAAVGCD